MISKFAVDQRVRLNKRCAITANVPKNSRGYKYTALALADDDKYAGEGLFDAGTEGSVVQYAAHGTGSVDNPIVRIKGKLIRIHQSMLEPV